MFFIGWILILLNVWAAVSTFAYYISNYELSFIALLIINAGALGIIIFASGLAIKNHLLLTISVPFLAAYGVFGLFSSSWAQGIPAEQFGNLYMTAGILYIISLTIKKKAYIEFILGVIIGMFLLIPFNKMQFDYFRDNPELVQKLENKKIEEPVKTISTTLEAITVDLVTPEVVTPIVSLESE